MMSESRSCMLLLLSAVAVLLSVSVATITLKYACPGDSVQVFYNIKFNHCNATVTLSIYGDRNEEIAVWSIRNCIQNERIIPAYQGRLTFDQNGTITINNIDHFDEATYVVISKMDPLPMIHEIELSLMVAPTEACKPMIKKLGNSLIASLKANDCGKPVAKPYWRDYDDVSNTNESILKLTPGMEAKNYNACIKGAALTCVKNVTSHDYCTTFPTEGSKSPPASLETCNALIAVCIILGIFSILAVLALAVIFIRKKKVKDEHITPLLENIKLQKEYFDKLNLEDIIQLLNEDHQRGLQTYFDNLKSQNEKPWREKEIQCDLENDREEVSTDQHNCNDPDKIRELTELRDADRCMICRVNEMSVAFLPCMHTATCFRCSKSLPQCPVCSAVMKDKLTV